MPIFMDRHNTEGATREDCAIAHEKDLATQGKYGARFLTYWFDAPNEFRTYSLH